MWGISKIVLFTFLVPGMVVGIAPYLMLPREICTGTVFDYLGIALVMIGVTLYSWCVRSFWVLGKGTPAPIDPPKKLVIQGPYKIVRNPMYVAVFLMLFGEVILYGSFGLLRFVAAFWVLVELLVHFYEEPVLQRKFGDAYKSYTRSVGRWIPHRGSGEGIE